MSSLTHRIQHFNLLF